jgi:hypothetical protein
VVESTNPQVDIKTEDFRILDAEPPGAFDIAGTLWSDQTDDLSRGHPEDLAMFTYSGLWKPGTPPSEGELVVMNLTTGRFRRIAFHGASATAGGFLDERKSVVLCGGVHGETSRPHVIDLTSGEDRRLGGEGWASAIATAACPFPSGKELAVLTRSHGGDMQLSQLWTLDITHNTATPIGDPMDAASLSPLPDGSGLVFEKRSTPDPSQPPVPAVCRVDLAGHVTALAEGREPCVLADGPSILFQDNQTQLWQLCDLDGEHARSFRDGLAGYGYPSPSPDGKRVLMLRLTTTTGPRPVIVPIDPTQKEIHVTVEPGLWMSPVWR